MTEVPDDTDWLRLLASHLRNEVRRHEAAKKEIQLVADRIAELLGLPEFKTTQLQQSQSTPTSAPQSKPTLPAQPFQELKAKDGTLLATFVRTGDNYSIRLKVTVTETTGSWKNFLVGGTKRILPSVAEKHHEFHYASIFEKGVLSRLELSGLDDGLWKEIKSPIAWALDRAREAPQ